MRPLLKFGITAKTPEIRSSDHGFIYGAARLVEKSARLLLEIEIRPRKGSRPVCSVCGKPGPGHDTHLAGTPF